VEAEEGRARKKREFEKKLVEDHKQ
jgi:hypothetical protein